MYLRFLIFSTLFLTALIIALVAFTYHENLFTVHDIIFVKILAVILILAPEYFILVFTALDEAKKTRNIISLISTSIILPGILISNLFLLDYNLIYTTLTIVYSWMKLALCIITCYHYYSVRDEYHILFEV